jgi:hypothetical protein
MASAVRSPWPQFARLVVAGRHHLVAGGVRQPERVTQLVAEHDRLGVVAVVVELRRVQGDRAADVVLRQPVGVAV